MKVAVYIDPLLFLFRYFSQDEIESVKNNWWLPSWYTDKFWEEGDSVNGDSRLPALYKNGISTTSYPWHSTDGPKYSCSCTTFTFSTVSAIFTIKIRCCEMYFIFQLNHICFFTGHWTVFLMYRIHFSLKMHCHCHTNIFFSVWVQGRSSWGLGRI